MPGQKKTPTGGFESLGWRLWFFVNGFQLLWTTMPLPKVLPLTVPIECSFFEMVRSPQENA